jgi:hypothetical protein
MNTFLRLKLPCFLVMIIVVSISVKVSAGGDNTTMGGRSMALGNASATIQDEWALFNNISGIAEIKNFMSCISYENRFWISSLNKTGLGLVYPLKKGITGISFYKFGDEFYNEIRVGLGYAHKIRNVSLGVKINYLQITIQEARSKKNMVIEFGGIAEITKQLVFGAHIYNLNQAKVLKNEMEYIPVTMKAGLSYRPSKKIMINAETEKELDFKAIFKAGIEYAIIEKLRLRTGISSNPCSNYFGAGIFHKNIFIDYAFNTHASLGSSHHISISWIFKKEE